MLPLVSNPSPSVALLTHSSLVRTRLSLLRFKKHLLFLSQIFIHFCSSVHPSQRYGKDLVDTHSSLEDMKETLILIALVTSVALESVDFRRFLIYRMSVTERQDREIVEIQKKDQESLLHSSQGSLARIHTPSFDAVRLSHFAEAVEVATRWVRHYGVNITVNHKFRPTAELSCPLERFELDCDPESKYRYGLLENGSNLES